MRALTMVASRFVLVTSTGVWHVFKHSADQPNSSVQAKSFSCIPASVPSATTPRGALGAGLGLRDFGADLLLLLLVLLLLLLLRGEAGRIPLISRWTCRATASSSIPGRGSAVHPNSAVRYYTLGWHRRFWRATPLRLLNAAWSHLLSALSATIGFPSTWRSIRRPARSA